MRAFTLIELIVVMVILGIMGGVGFSMYSPNTTYRDGEVALLKLKQARYKAMGYEGRLDEGCVTLSREGFSDSDAKPGAYTLRSEVTSSATTLCFDHLGRPHEDDTVDLDSLLQEDLEITFTKDSQECTIRVHKQSGYAIIACNN